MAKVGRPRIDEPKKYALGVRVTDSEYQAIKEYARTHGMTITEMLLKGIREMIKEPKSS